MLRLLCVFYGGAAFGWGVLAALLLDWATAMGLWAGAVFFLIAAAMATAPKPEVMPMPRLRVVGKERGP